MTVKLVPTIPETVTLCGLEIKTVYEAHMAADYDRWGDFSNRTHVIALEKDMSVQKTLLTYCHELSHAIVEIHALKDMEESDIQAIGLGIYELLMQGKLCKVVDE